jgi:hypothetical protein
MKNENVCESKILGGPQVTRDERVCQVFKIEYEAKELKNLGISYLIF